ncbi:hypothetical protein LSH36_161g05042 [Paralvinella palmiformis]|uniref:Tip elongation aberrant protein 1 n=1 Tax=Paralvinella palmiformis TaxID=53620 RepID=A0AAD9JVD9_9ANNE|nr:hypothetical protein LSH36_161g05042 [Paralvinella palmiformis]
MAGGCIHHADTHHYTSDQHTHSSLGQCVQHRAIRSTPQSSRYTWHNVTCPSYELEGRGPIVPPNRCKHAACLHDNHIYIYGGRNGGVCHGDMWRYNLAEKTWEQLSCHGDVPLSPQEHTMLAYKSSLYLFGGQFWCSYDNEAPLWILDLESSIWRRSCIESDVLTPGGRRGHTAVIDHAIMYIYGGYIDLKGSSNELWMFDLDNEIWHLSHNSMTNEMLAEGRHGHSAVVYEGAMFVYGGMANLVAKCDLWKYEFTSCQWSRIKSRPSPPALKGHTACVIADQMLVFGGTSHGSMLNTLWCFHFGSTSWCRISTRGISPPASLQHAVVAVIARVHDATNSHERASSHPQLQAGKDLAKCFEIRPYSSPASLTTHKVIETELSAFFMKNKITPSESPPNYERNSYILRGSPEFCLPQDTAPDCVQLTNNVLERNKQPSGIKESTVCDLTDKIISSDGTIPDLEQTISQTFVKCKDADLTSPMTYASCGLTNGNTVKVGETMRHRGRHISNTQYKYETLFEDVPETNTAFCGDGPEKDFGSRVRCFSDAESNLLTHSATLADDLKLEDIEDDDTLSSFYLGGVTNQYIFNDSLASSSDILNLSNSSETTQLVNSEKPHRPNQPSKKSHTPIKIQCLSPTDRSRSLDSLPYGTTNPLLGLYSDHQSSSVDELRNVREDVTHCISCDRSDNDDVLVNRPNEGNTHSLTHKNVHPVNMLNNNDPSSACTVFLNPCYFNDFDHEKDIDIGMLSLEPQIGDISDRKMNIFLMSEDRWSTCQVWNGKERNGKLETYIGMENMQGETIKRKSSKSHTRRSVSPRSTTPALIPALPMIDHRQRSHDDTDENDTN